MSSEQRNFSGPPPRYNNRGQQQQGQQQQGQGPQGQGPQGQGRNRNTSGQYSNRNNQEDPNFNMDGNRGQNQGQNRNQRSNRGQGQNQSHSQNQGQRGQRRNDQQRGGQEDQQGNRDFDRGYQDGGQGGRGRGGRGNYGNQGRGGRGGNRGGYNNNHQQQQQQPRQQQQQSQQQQQQPQQQQSFMPTPMMPVMMVPMMGMMPPPSSQPPPLQYGNQQSSSMTSLNSNQSDTGRDNRDNRNRRGGSSNRGNRDGNQSTGDRRNQKYTDNQGQDFQYGNQGQQRNQSGDQGNDGSYQRNDQGQQQRRNQGNRSGRKQNNLQDDEDTRPSSRNDGYDQRNNQGQQRRNQGRGGRPANVQRDNEGIPSIFDVSADKGARPKQSQNRSGSHQQYAEQPGNYSNQTEQSNRGNRSGNINSGNRGNRGRGRGGQRSRGSFRGNRGRPFIPRGGGTSRVTAADSDDSIFSDSDMESWVSEATTVADINDLKDDLRGNFSFGNRGRGFFRGGDRGVGFVRGRRPNQQYSRGRSNENDYRNMASMGGYDNENNSRNVGVGDYGGRGQNRGRARGRGRGREPRGRGVQQGGNQRGGRKNIEQPEDSDNENKKDDGMEKERTGNSSILPDINLDDIGTVSMTVLVNRVKRYKTKLQACKKGKADSGEIRARQGHIQAIQKEIDRRRKANPPKKKVEAEEDTGTDEDSEDESTETESEEEEVAPVKVSSLHKLRKSQSAFAKKGSVSFRPKSMKSGKLKPKHVAKVFKQESISEQSDDDSEEEIVETVNVESDKPKKKRERKRKKKEKKLSFNEDEKEEAAVAGNEKGKQKNAKTRKHKNSGGDTDARMSKDKQVIDDLLDKFDEMIVGGQKLKTEKKIPPLKSDMRREEERPVESLPKEKVTPVDLANDVFKFIVKEFEGKGEPNDIRKESGLFPIDCDVARWFKASRRLFNTIERNGRVILVLAFMRDISYCLDYIKVAGCSKECTRFHVCKDMLCGNCFYGSERCKFSHDFLDERNVKVARRLGLSKIFTSEEICTILRVRYPHICPIWMENGCCDDDIDCPFLHMCQKYILGKCLEGATCPLVHDKCSPHNKPIVDAFAMGQWQDSIFKRMIYMQRSGTAQPEAMEVDSEPRSPGVLECEPTTGPKRERTISSDDDVTKSDKASDQALCDRDLVGACNRRGCRLIHSKQKMPYIWQVKQFGEWTTLSEQETIERKFCENQDFYNVMETTKEGMTVTMCFTPVIHAMLTSERGKDSHHVEARRLSTSSYNAGKTQSEGFKTQWRWYFQNETSKWQLFEPDSFQHTLEAKFLAKQSNYHYSRENYRWKYTIDFNAMMQFNLDTRKTRTLLRRPIFINKDAVKAGLYPGSLQQPPTIEAKLPKNWVPWDLAHPFELVKLSENHPSYVEVASNFYKTLTNKQIIDTIFRVQNHALWSSFCNQEKTMIAHKVRDGSDTPVVKHNLYHGTYSLDAVRGISINNFDARVSGKNATVYGDGAYFARDSRYSHSYTDPPASSNQTERFMFQALVLVGEYTSGNKSYRRPPTKPGKDHELYDSCVNDMNDPSIFILFEKNQYYPEFLIQYHNDSAGIVTEAPAPPVRVRKPAPVPPASLQNLMGRVSSVGSASGHSSSSPYPTGYQPPRQSPSPTVSMEPSFPAQASYRSPSPPVMAYPRHPPTTPTSPTYSYQDASQGYPSPIQSYPSVPQSYPNSAPRQRQTVVDYVAEQALKKAKKKEESCCVQ